MSMFLPIMVPNNSFRSKKLTPPLSKEEQQFVRKVLDTFLFHAREVNDTLIMPLSAIAGEQAN